MCVSFQYSVNDDSKSFESILILCALWQGTLIVIRNVPCQLLFENAERVKTVSFTWKTEASLGKHQPESKAT